MERIAERESLNDSNLAVEVASNDGDLLQWYQPAGVPLLGIEPARNIAHAAETLDYVVDRSTIKQGCSGRYMIPTSC